MCCALNESSDNLLCSAAYGLVVMPKDFASYLLGIVLVNLFIYFFCYITMKVSYICLHLMILKRHLSLHTIQVLYCFVVPVALM